MKKIMKATVVALVLGFTTLYAGSGHTHGAHGHSHSHHKVGEATAKETADKQLRKLLKGGKIDKSWSTSFFVDMKKKQFHHSQEWVARYKNEKMQDTSKKTLYIFVSLTGKITGANYTGK